ncbi:MAG: phosphoserine phosphatase SerB [Candidatus Hydrogenedentes bacterium]|nr:phosphoserine phosphatase SerB [Candidatus Hydrogenedentota bacterium]
MHEIILLTVSGEDKPGITSVLTQIMAEHGVNILDIGQAVIHELLTLGMLIEVPPGPGSGPMLKDLLFKAHELDLKIRFTPVPLDKYAHWVGQQGKERHIITVLGRKLTAHHLAAVSAIIARHGLNIDVITRLSGRIPIEESARAPYACVEFSVRGTPADTDGMRAEFLMLAHEEEVDIAFQADDVYRRNRRLVAFDMDSTLIQAEVIDELAAAAGVKDRVSAITEQAMRGEMDFKDSLRRRLGLLRGLEVRVMEDILRRLPLTDGVERLFQLLKTLGFKTAIISGGFTWFGERLREKLGADYVFANELEIVDGKLTGNVVGDIVDGEKKAALLRQLAARENIDLRQVIAVGDGANDLPMLRLAGLGIAFRAKPVVKQSARQALSSVGLDGILYLIGVRDREMMQSVKATEA